jgi:hypothetical protein
VFLGTVQAESWSACKCHMAPSRSLQVNVVHGLPRHGDHLPGIRQAPLRLCWVHRTRQVLPALHAGRLRNEMLPSYVPELQHKLWPAGEFLQPQDRHGLPGRGAHLPSVSQAARRSNRTRQMLPAIRTDPSTARCCRPWWPAGECLQPQDGHELLVVAPISQAPGLLLYVVHIGSML